MHLIEKPLTFNERLLVELIFLGRADSRPEIARQTGLTGATVTRLVNGMLDKGLLSEKANPTGAMGQPVRLLSFTPRKVYSVGVNFMRGRFDMALVDLTGKVVDFQQYEMDEITPQSIAKQTQTSLNEMATRHPEARDNVIGVGFSVPANFAPDGLTLRAHDYFGSLNGINLKHYLQDQLPLFCAVENDGACGSMGEYLHGKGRNSRTLFFIHIGHGLGGGTIINGMLYRGPHGNSSKPGVLFPYDQPRPSGQDLIECLQAEGAPVSDIADLESVMADYAQIVETWLDRASKQLAEVQRVATAFLDPEIIVLGGRLPTTYYTELVDRIRTLDLDGPSRDLPVACIEASELGPHSGALGAASIPIFELMFPGSVESRHSPYINGRRRT